MRFCPPFKFATKGGFNLSQVPKDGVVENGAKRPTIRPIEPFPSTSISSINTERVDVNINENKISSNVSNSTESKKSSSNKSKNEKDIVGISDIVEAETKNKRENVRKRGVITSKEEEDSTQAITDIKYQKYDKDEKSIALIKKALNGNDFIKNLMDDERLNSVVEAMSSQEYEAGNLIIKEGEQGSHLFVSAEGSFEVIKDEKTVKKFGPGVAFGELAILYKAKRFASVQATTKAKVWVLQRNVFKKIMLRSGKQEQEDNLKFLSGVPILEGIHPNDLLKISDLLKREFFLAGTMIVRQGDRGDKFYIIRGGTVSITKRPPDGGPEEFVKEISRGDYFGEQALLHEDRRLATVTAKAPGVECLTLDRIPFNEFLGNIDKLKGKSYPDPRSSNVSRKPPVFSPEYDSIKLEDLEIVGTLGVGGFGRVELVQYTKDKSKTFALKCLKKVDVVQQMQQEHAFNEKSIMIRCNSPFVCKLFKTYKDNKYLYFLMEPVLGGDVWTILQKKRNFNEQTSRFMTACVVEAIEHLHSLDIIYRDLKPENLMLDSAGYVKLVDFGYAKFLSLGSKSYTFAGTPEYVAPEIILNKGHDKAVDYWALGIFVHELLVGKPPFRGTNHMKTYNLILRGIDAIDFNPKLPKVAQLLIKKLCRPVPVERLGYAKNGIKDIKNHKWFLGFDWDKLRNRTMQAPLVRPITSPTDLNNFEKYPKDKLPPDETSGWDIDF